MKQLLILAALAHLCLTGCNNSVTTSSSNANPSQNENYNTQTDPQDSSSEDIINGDASEPK